MGVFSERFEALDHVIDEHLDKSSIPGIAIGIVNRDGIMLYEKYHGLIDIKQGIAPERNAIFRLASISKTLTTVGLLQQWELGKFQIDDPVNNYLPKGKIVVKPGWPEVSFGHLLTHRSGIGEIIRKRDAFKPGFGLLVTGRDTPIPSLSTIHDRDLRPEVPAGTKYSYSNIGFSILGYVIEQLSGESFRDYMVNHVLDPAGMTHSDFIPSDRLGKIEAIGYKKSLGRQVPAKYYQNIIMPAGNLYSCIGDMAKYAATLLDGGRLPSAEQLLKPETLEMAWTPQYWAHDALKDDASIGFCFHLYRINGTRVVEHTGATSGFTSCISLVPSEQFAVLVFSNHDEIFGKRQTLRLKRAILTRLCSAGLQETRDTTSIQLNRDLAKKILGYYGPNPGILTNTRVIAYLGGDFRIGAKNDKLFLSSLYGRNRKGRELKPLPSGDAFQIEVKADEDEEPEHVAFMNDENSNITGMAIDLLKFRKNPLVNTLRFKIYLAVLIGFIILFSFLFLVILKSW
ncbi:MAG TPA: serine hydrolase domain-containing protein [Candidatus Lokiarchaeia archaeon]|nr:serine hydrolase domain-containing protein [Candidatus Lokiarchaeia archaeon]